MNAHVPAKVWSPALNQQIISAAIEQGRPIRDTYVTAGGALKDVEEGTVLYAERQQLKEAGWRFNQKSGEWTPQTFCTGSRIASDHGC
jgi:hypothetical protein